MMELEIYKPTESQFIQVIEFNYPELKAQLSENLEKYKGLVFTEDQMAQAKKQRADLNRFKKALEDKRIEVKKQLLDPYLDFEVKIKDLTGMVDEVTAGIDIQIKAYEEQLREKKRQGILAIYQDIVPEDFQAIMPLEKISEEKWLNATVSLKSITGAILDRFDGCMMDMDVLKELDSPYQEQIKAFYLRTLDIGKAITEGKRLEAEAAKIREYEERKKAAAAAYKAPQEAPVRQQTTTFQQVQESREPAAPELIEIAFRMWVTEEQKQELKAWIRKNNIRVGKV